LSISLTAVSSALAYTPVAVKKIKNYCANPKKGSDGDAFVSAYLSQSGLETAGAMLYCHVILMQLTPPVKKITTSQN
jgi:hypothetical protein